MNEHKQKPVIILVAGHWLGAWAWDDVVTHLSRRNHTIVALTLPGLDLDDPHRLTRTPFDQAEAIITAMREASAATNQPVVLVGHSGANAPISIAMDRHPELVARVVWVDSGPVTDGNVFDPELPEDVHELPLPDFDLLGKQASLDGLDAEALQQFRLRAVPQPGPVLRMPITLTNEERRTIPTTLVCCSIPSEQLKAFAQSGHPMMAEVAYLEDVASIDLPTGHWPMWSRPEDLAHVIHEATGTANHA